MNEQLQKLLEAAGLGDFSQYFTGDLSQITSLLGLKGDQAGRFGQFFQQFNPETYLEAAGAAIWFWYWIWSIVKREWTVDSRYITEIRISKRRISKRISAWRNCIGRTIWA